MTICAWGHAYARKVIIYFPSLVQLQVSPRSPANTWSTATMHRPSTCCWPTLQNRQDLRKSEARCLQALLLTTEQVETQSVREEVPSNPVPPSASLLEVSGPKGVSSQCFTSAAQIHAYFFTQGLWCA